jgi:hypothetical protein
MQQPRSPESMQPESSPRSRIINSYLSPIEDSIRRNHSQIKLINYGTGSGKTYQLFRAICETATRHPDIQIIGIYVAPLREHLQAPTSVTNQYPTIPIYTINSLEMKTTDERIQSYKKWISSILNNKPFWSTIAAHCSREKVEEARLNLSKAKSVISRLEYVKKADFGDNKFTETESTKAIRDLNGLFENFVEFLIRNKPDEDSWPDECFGLVEIFFPLYLLREKSGILMLTYDKFETLIPYFSYNGQLWIKRNGYLL